MNKEIYCIALLIDFIISLQLSKFLIISLNTGFYMKKIIYIPLSLLGIIALLYIVGEIRRPGIGKYMIEMSYSFIFKDRIKQMFKENMNLINRVLNTCQTSNDENKAAQEINAVMNDYITLLKEYYYLNNQRLAIDNEFGPDWAGAMHTQWMQTLYTLKKTIDGPQGKINAIAINIIMNTLNISLKELNEHVMEMSYLDQQKKKAQTSME